MIDRKMSDKERMVTVCNSCFRASCWHGEFMCEGNKSAGTKQVPVWQLDADGREHPDHYSGEKVRKVCG